MFHALVVPPISFEENKEWCTLILDLSGSTLCPALSRAKANRVLPRECTGRSKHPLPTTQEKTLHMESPDGQHGNQIDYILCSKRWRSSIQLTKTRPGADCGSDHELLIAKFRLKLKKVGKTIRSFRYDLNQIPYDYTVEDRNRFKGLDLIDRVPMNYGRRFVA